MTASGTLATPVQSTQATVRRATPADDARWDAYVTSNPAGHRYHLSAWRRIIESSFAHDSYSLVAEAGDGRLSGVLPLTRVRSRLFGDFLVSLPYVNYGGPCADDRPTARALVRSAVDLARSLGVAHLELRTEDACDEYGLRARAAKVSARLPLPASADALWKTFPSKLRSQVNRALKENMTVRVGGEDELDAFYQVFSINMRDLGTPVYSRNFFRNILREQSFSSRLVTLHLGSVAVAAGFLIGFKTTIEVPWASSLREYNRLSPNMLLYWSMLKYACEAGYAEFDFGRSSPDSGPYKFKLQWGARPAPLNWHYYVRDDGALPELSPQNPRYRMAVRMWQRMPLALTRLIGPPIVKNIP
jgi:serine/alanine adding enzyme